MGGGALCALELDVAGANIYLQNPNGPEYANRMLGTVTGVKPPHHFNHPEGIRKGQFSRT